MDIWGTAECFRSVCVMTTPAGKCKHPLRRPNFLAVFSRKLRIRESSGSRVQADWYQRIPGGRRDWLASRQARVRRCRGRFTFVGGKDTFSRNTPPGLGALFVHFGAALRLHPDWRGSSTVGAQHSAGRVVAIFAHVSNSCFNRINRP